MMPIAMWSHQPTEMGPGSRFLIFERVRHTGEMHERIGLVWTLRLAARTRFLRHATERELTII